MDFVAPPQPQVADILGAYIRGKMLPLALQEQQQKVQQGALSLEQARMALKSQSAMQDFALGQLNGTASGTQPTQTGNAVGGASGGIQNGPQAQYGASSGPVAAPWWANPTTGAALAVLQGKDPAEGASHALAYQTQQMNDQAQRTKLALQPVVDNIETVRTANNPEQLVMANPAYKQVWDKYAPALGLNPNDPKSMTSDNVRAVAAMAHNDLAAQSMGTIAAVPMPATMQRGPLGSLFERQSGTLKQVKGEEDLTQVVGADGQPRFVTKPEAYGQTPYNAQTFVNTAAIGPQAEAIASYRQPMPSGFFMKTAQGQALMQQVYALNPQYDATQYTAKNAGFTKFTSGKQGDTVRSLSVATSHLDTLGSMVDALKNGDVRMLNTIGNRWQQETGSPAPTNFDTVKNIVADEVTKAVIGYGGSQGDREKAAAVIDRANSPEQLKGAIESYKTLMGGQLQGLRRQYEKATGRNDFDSMLSDEAKSELGGSSSGGLQTGQSATVGQFKVTRVK